MDRAVKSDAYMKLVLTVIAVCLVWICVKDMVGPQRSFAQGVSSDGREPVPVRIVEIARGRNGRTAAKWEPLLVSGSDRNGTLSVRMDQQSTVPVHVENWPESQPVQVNNWPKRVMAGWPPGSSNTPSRGK
jgi:hypothetical protein